MKRGFAIAALVCAAAFAEDKIPAGAKEISPNVYSYTDAHGKKWLLRRSPFGLMRTEDKGTDAAQTAAAPGTAPGVSEAPKGEAVRTKVIDLGDKVRFERPSPFGKTAWTRKKSELTDDERALVDASAAPAPATGDNSPKVEKSAEQKH